MVRRAAIAPGRAGAGGRGGGHRFGGAAAITAPADMHAGGGWRGYQLARRETWQRDWNYLVLESAK